MKLPAWIVVPHPTTEGDAPAGRGPEGNTRLTAATGMVLVAVLAVEAVTLLSVRQMLTLHVFVGVLVLGPVLLKTASTMYRFVRYYSRSPAYVRKGPPHPFPRILGPFLILSSLALLGTGIAAIYVSGQGSRTLIDLHQIAFWVWVSLLGVHLIGHLWEAAVTSRAELRGALTGAGSRGRRVRLAVVTLALVAGVAGAVLVLPAATTWTTQHEQTHIGPRPQP